MAKRLQALSRLKSYGRELSLLRERIQALESMEVFITSQYHTGGGPTGFAGDGKSVSVKLMDLRAKLALSLLKMEEELQTAEKLIDELPQDQREIIQMRYRDGWSWTKIIREKNYSDRRIFQLHAAAIQKLSENGME